MSMVFMRLPDELTDQFDALAAATGRSKSWQIAEITQAMQEADAGDFASDDELNAVSAKWRRSAG